MKHTREARIACLLTTLRSAVELERKELERLHRIDVAATALDQLAQEYAKQKEQFEAAMEAQRSVWEENVQNTERERKEQEEAFKKQRQREIDEYEYKKNPAEAGSRPARVRHVVSPRVYGAIRILTPGCRFSFLPQPA